MAKITPEPQPVDQKNKDEIALKNVSIWKLFTYADANDKMLCFIGMICGLLQGASMPIFSVLLGGLFDGINDQSTDVRETTSEFAFYFFYLGIGSFVAAACQVGMFTIAAERQAIKFRHAYLEALLNQEVAWFDVQKTGALTSKVSENTVLIKEAMGDKLGNLFQFMSMAVSGMAVGFYYSWRLTLSILACAPFLGIGGAIMMKAMTEATSGSLGAYARAGSVVDEAISAIRTVASYGLEDKISKTYDSFLLEAEEEGIKKGRATGFGMGFTFGFYFATYAVAFYFGGKFIEDDRTAFTAAYPPVPLAYLNGTCTVGAQAPEVCGEFVFESDVDVCGCFVCGCGCYSPSLAGQVEQCFSGGDVILVFFSVVMAAFSVGQASPSISALGNGKSAAAQMFQILDRVPKIQRGKRGERPAEVDGVLEFQRVRFAYPSRPDQPIFKCLDLRIESNRSCALVGSSGCGKSTCIALIQRFYDPLEGRVLLDGVDLKSLDLVWLRQHIGLVGQEPVLFATSIRDNIAYGLPGEVATAEQVEAAARAANAHDFVTGFPAGYDTLVGEKGAQLSGGQKQRIAIARAIIRDPHLLLLDEATSALDNESERVVQEALDRLLTTKKRTTVIIAHRLSTIRNADNIVVLDKGDVVEQGDHDALLRLDGAYAKLQQTQGVE